MILEGTTSSGAVVPVQVTGDGKVVAEGQQGPQGPEGPPGADGGSFALPPNPRNGDSLMWENGTLIWGRPLAPVDPDTGITWTTQNSAADNGWLSVCWSPERSLFVAVAHTGTSNRVMTSPDGITWTTQNSALDNSWHSVCWSPERSLFVAVAASGTGNRVMTSPS